jgi:hypothetical protein
MTPITINLEPAVRGDKWQGVAAIGPIIVNGVAPTLPLARIRMQFRKSENPGMTFDTESGEGVHPIQILNAATWFAQIPEVQPLPLGAGDWAWDMEFWAEGDTAPLTFYKGILRVLLDATR